MGVRAAVGGRAVVPQAGKTLTAMGGGGGHGTPKLTVRTGGCAEGPCAMNKPAAHWLHRREST